MRILVLGASGGCGRWVTLLAVGGGHVVTALVRPGTPFTPPSVDWVAVRPVTLVHAGPWKRARVMNRFSARSVVGRADVAQWVLDAATDTRPVAERTPMIGGW